MTRVDWSRVDTALAELFDSASVDAAVDDGLRLGDLRFRRTLRMLQAAATAAVVAVTGAALMLQGAVHAEGEPGSSPPPRVLPVVQSVTPREGSHEGGQTVVIGGKRLAGAEKVLFGDTGADLIDVSDNEVVAVSPPHAPGTVAVVVVTERGARSSSTATYRFLEAPRSTLPVLARVSPDSGPASGGTRVTIWGTRLDRTQTVTFGGIPVDADTFLARTDTSITLATPRHGVGRVDVTVTTDTGTSRSVPFTFTDDGTPLPSDSTSAVTPVVDGVTPDVGALGGGVEVTISGSNLGDVTAVEFDGVPAKIVSGTDEAIRVVVPARDTSGFAAVTVTGLAGSSDNTPGVGYTYLPQPSVSGVGPAVGGTGGGQPVTIRGSALARATTVDFGGTEITRFSASDGSISLVTPPHSAGLADITVTTPGGTSEVDSKVAAYLYADPPTVTGVDPVEVCTQFDGEVTITGSGFTGSGGTWLRGITFGDVAATVRGGEVSFGQIKVVPPPHAAGTVPVTVTTAAGPSAPGPAAQLRYVDCVG